MDYEQDRTSNVWTLNCKQFYLKKVFVLLLNCINKRLIATIVTVYPHLSLFSVYLANECVRNIWSFNEFILVNVARLMHVLHLSLDTFQRAKYLWTSAWSDVRMLNCFLFYMIQNLFEGSDATWWLNFFLDCLRLMQRKYSASATHFRVW